MKRAYTEVEMKKMYFFMGLFIFVSISFFLKRHVFPSHKADWITSIPIAHRGFFDNDQGIPENSLMAFQRAVDKGYAIELDVMLTKDGYVVVYHDHDLKRLSSIHKRVDALTLKELQSYKLLKTTEVPPTLHDVLHLVDDQVPLYIEIKYETYSPAGELEEKVAELLEDYEGRVAILSFNPQSLEWFAQNAPHYYRGQSYDPPPEELGKKMRIFMSMLQTAWITHPHFMVYDHTRIPKALLRLFSSIRTMISYNVHSQADYEKATFYATNVIFEKINLESQ